jgi:glycosyltransferase involved in cell wall biosynthesis
MSAPPEPVDHPVYDEPLVSVIVPVYNGEHFIKETLESAMLQTYRNLEIIVVDDGSTDGTRSVVAECAARDPRIRVVHQPNGGVARARNTGLAAARGEFAATLDGDDLWDPVKIDRQVARIREAGEETAFVYCWWMWIDTAGKVLDRSPRWDIEGDVLGKLLQVNFTGNASVPLFRRRCLEEVGGYDESFESQRSGGCEDWDIVLRLAARYKAAVVPELLVGYRNLPGSMSKQCEMMWRSQAMMTGRLRELNPSLDPALFRQSADQFALYISGVMFRIGSYHRAAWWALRAWRTEMLYRVMPYVALAFIRRLDPRRRSVAAVMAPGLHFDAESEIPPPLIPYDRIYARIERSAQAAGRGVKRMTNSGEVAAPGESVVREFLQRGKSVQLGGGSSKASGAGARNRIDGWLRSRRLQAALVLIAFLSIAALHVHEDGLWFQGDAPRHGANGFFWWDLISTRPSSPMDFAVRYYARYPVINPIVYPPLFYVLEGAAFRVLSPSPFVAKGLILAFAVMAGFYTMAWARRWIGEEAGWAGAFLAFLPGIVLWTNTVMLNIPASVLAIACLYHWRCWLEFETRKQLLAAILFGMAAILTYYQSAIALAICAVWGLVFRRTVRIKTPRFLWFLGICVIVAVPVVVAGKVTPLFVTRNLPALHQLASPAQWTFYALQLPGLFGVFWLVLALAGFLALVRDSGWRREAVWLGCWFAVPILALSILPAKDARYILLVAPAIVLFATAAAVAVVRRLPAERPARRALLLAAGTAIAVWGATRVHAPQVTGFRAVAEYLRAAAPSDAILYDGYHDGLFGFYVRALDPGYQRRIVLGQELLYHYGPAQSYEWVETMNAATVPDVVNLLRTRCGCRWLAIEAGDHSEWAQGQRLLREAVRQPDFELMRSFPVVGSGASRVDLYRLRGPITPVSTIALSLPSYSGHTFSRVVPITR